MKKHTVALAVILLLLVTAVVVGGSLFSSSYLSNQRKTARAERTCHGVHASHSITIKDNEALPASVTATRCDTLTITNTDNRVRNMAFGKHDRHQAYDGITEKQLAQGQSLTVTLNEPGAFLIHDHFDDDVISTFTVKP